MKDTILITAEDIEVEHVEFIDVLAVAAGYPSFHDIDDGDYLHEVLVNATKGYVDNEWNFINALNDVNKPREGLQFGAWLALNRPDEYAERYAVWSEWYKDKGVEFYQEGNTDRLDAGYVAEIDGTISFHNDYVWREFLYGDRSSNGMLGALNSDVIPPFSEDVSEPREGSAFGAIEVDVDLDEFKIWWSETHGDYDDVWDCDEHDDVTSCAKDAIVLEILSAYKVNTRANRERAERRKADAERRREWEQKKEEMRRAKLLEMKAE